MPKSSSGIILYHREDSIYKILLGHMGGPFWSKKDYHAWSIPKGEFDLEHEKPIDAAKREFKEETGIEITESLIPLTPYSKNNKRLYFFLCEKYINPDSLKSNSFELEWPPKSGKMAFFPELDRFGWFTLDEAKIKIVKGQLPALEEVASLVN